MVVSRRFVLQVAGFALAASAGVWAIKASGYRLDFDVQRVIGAPHCLPSFLYLSRMRVDHAPHRGDYVVARMPDSGMTVGAREGTRILKAVAGVPGDHIRIAGTELYINEMHRDRLWLAKSLPGRQPGDFDTDRVLQEGEYFLMGTTKESFDSRYWGPIREDAILGYARPLL